MRPARHRRDPIAQVVEHRANTLCGVPEYLAPEVVTAAGHALAVDLWALGVLIFELATKRSLFSKAGEDAGDLPRLFARIARPEPTLKRVWSATHSYASLVAGLLQVRPDDRLGRRHEGFGELWAHRFFRGLDPARDLGGDRAPWTPPPLSGLRETEEDPLLDVEDAGADDATLPPLAFLASY